jgi:hypothetical protein
MDPAAATPGPSEPVEGEVEGGPVAATPSPSEPIEGDVVGGPVATARNEGALLRAFRAKVAANGGGVYGVGACVQFLLLEGVDLYGIWLAAGGWGGLIDRLLGGLWGFGMDSFMNAFRAGIWPFEVYSALGVLGGVAVGLLLMLDVFEEDVENED